MLNFTDLAIRRGPRVLFAGATFGLFRGEKVGITGQNGTGKSSLMSLVLGEVQPEAGRFEMPGNLEIAHVSQEVDAVERIALEFVLDGDVELREMEARIATLELTDDGMKLAEAYAAYAAMGGYDARSRAGQLMHGLGFSSHDETRVVSEFSGGWRVRLNVARALMCRSDLLLLDEPTNHLDLDAILWLETWLREYQGTLLLITHDREFLDRIANRIVNLEHGKATAYRGNYSQFEDQRASELALQSALFTRQQREIKHMESFVERFKAQASKARQAQSRIKALERMQRIAPAHVDTQFEFSFPQPARLPRPLLAIEDQSAGYDGRVLLEHVKITIYPGDRIALLGRNGAGKSTCMKLLAGALEAMSGQRTEARDLGIAYFAQHQLEQLTMDESALMNLKRQGGPAAPRASEQELRDFLASFGFRGDRVFEKVGPFSGGEKARLMLAIVAFRRPNLLLLDEPTNHLDLEMRQALAVALQEYAGAVVFVSHDRHMLRTVADELYLVDDGRVRPFDGDLDDYSKWLATREAAAAAAPPHPPPPEVSAAPAPVAPAGKKGGKGVPVQKLRLQVADCERELEELARRTADVERRLSAPELYAASDSPQLKALLEEQATLRRRTEQVEAAWLTASEALQ